MASFTLLRELASIERDQGLKRLLIALYQTDSGHKYVAASEQKRPTKEDSWVSAMKGITVRRAELDSVIKALSGADLAFDKGPDTGKLSDREYAELYLDWG
jgi:hypothetical protein